MFEFRNYTPGLVSLLVILFYTYKDSRIRPRKGIVALYLLLCSHFSSNSFTTYGFYLFWSLVPLVHLIQTTLVALMFTVFLRPTTFSMSFSLSCWEFLRVARAPFLPSRLDFRWRTPGDIMSPNWVALCLFMELPKSICSPPLFNRALLVLAGVRLKSRFDLRKSTFLNYKVPELEGLLFMTSMNVST